MACSMYRSVLRACVTKTNKLHFFFLINEANNKIFISHFAVDISLDFFAVFFVEVLVLEHIHIQM